MLQPSERSTQSNLLESKYWTIAAELPSLRIIQELVEIFFTDMNWYYSILERHYFDKLNGSWLKASGFENGSVRRGPLKSFPETSFTFQLYCSN